MRPLILSGKRLPNWTKCGNGIFQTFPVFKLKSDLKLNFLFEMRRNFTHIWKVTKVIPEKLIGYSWNFDEYSGEGYSTFELTSREDKTILHLKSEVIREFPDDIPEFKRERGENGWNYLITQSLLNFLTKTE